MLLRRMLTSAAVAAVLAAPAMAQTTLTVANWLPPSHPLVSEVIVPMMNEIKEATHGEVAPTMLPAPLGPPAAHFDFAVNGVADITFGVQGYTPGRFATTNLAEMPFMGNSAEADSVAYWRTWEKYLKPAGEYDQVKVLGVFTHGPGEIYLKNGDVTSPDVMQGKKMRVGGGIINQIAAALGSVPVEGPSSKAYELLSQGVADGIFFPAESVNSFGLIPELTDAIEVPGGLFNTSFFVVMNKKKWDSLTPEEQKEINSVTGEHLAHLAGQMWDRADAKGRAAMKGKITISQATDAQLAAWKKDLQPVIDAKMAEVDKAGVDSKAAMAYMKDQIAKEEAAEAKAE